MGGRSGAAYGEIVVSAAYCVLSPSIHDRLALSRTRHVEMLPRGTQRPKENREVVKELFPRFERSIVHLRDDTRHDTRHDTRREVLPGVGGGVGNKKPLEFQGF